MTEHTNEELADRLYWWLEYFNDDTKGRHPDFVGDPEGFDETAIEADLREAARRLREMDGERIEGWADSDYGDDDYDSGLMDFWAGDKPTHDTRDANGKEMVIWVRATLILHPQSPTAQKRTERPVSFEEKNDE